MGNCNPHRTGGGQSPRHFVHRNHHPHISTTAGALRMEGPPRRSHPHASKKNRSRPPSAALLALPHAQLGLDSPSSACALLDRPQNLLQSSGILRTGYCHVPGWGMGFFQQPLPAAHSSGTWRTVNDRFTPPFASAASASVFLFLQCERIVMSGES